MVAGTDVRYFWHEAAVPLGLEITQVYGYLICPETGRVLIQDDEGTFNLPGGTPEPWDEGLFATLAREAAEESQVRVDAAVYLGFQEVHRPPSGPDLRPPARLGAEHRRRGQLCGGKVPGAMIMPDRQRHLALGRSCHPGSSPGAKSLGVRSICRAS